ncbi:MAG: hypothetical protein JRG92_04875 [Deltaproteobacteria bacterium]|nr:hypothetical protein [Deltaproteobacteria bacterium]MBW2382944.1 hypothetical protein [Deltaproteobacteria bacterium]
MSARIRRTLALLVAFSLLLMAGATHASEISMEEEEAKTPIVWDAMVMRPLGIAALAVGVAFFAVSTPIVAITRPSDIGKVGHVLIVKPAKYVWVDPIGTH